MEVSARSHPASVNVRCSTWSVRPGYLSVTGGVPNDLTNARVSSFSERCFLIFFSSLLPGSVMSPIMKPRKCVIGEWMVRWIDSWLTGKAQRVVISGAAWWEAWN